MLQPTQELQIYLIRGDIWQQTIGLGNFPDVVADPAAYKAVWSFRTEQNDNLPILLELDGVWETITSEECSNVDILSNFEATVAETSTLPPFNIKYFCDLRTIAGDFIERLFQGDVIVSD